MIHVLTNAELKSRPDLWSAVLHLRHDIFVEEMGWEDLRRPENIEFDQFDHDDAIHHLAFRNGELAGYQRMLPTTQPHLLTDVLQDLCEGPSPKGPDVYELTRYAVAAKWRDGRRGVSTVGSELIAGFIEWGMTCGVNKVIIEFEPMWVLRALQLRFLAMPLGYQRTYGRQQVVATLLAFDDETLKAVRNKRGHFAPVMEFEAPFFGERRIAS